MAPTRIAPSFLTADVSRLAEEVRAGAGIPRAVTAFRPGIGQMMPQP